MKKLKSSLLTLLLPVMTFVALSNVAEAGPAEDQAKLFVEKLNSVILYPTIALLSAIAFLMFLWGCAEYFMNAANEEARRKGVSHITYGIIGLVVMVSAYTILALAAGTFGLSVA